MTLRLRYPDGTVETYLDDGSALDRYARSKGWYGAIQIQTADGWPITYDEAARRFLSHADASVDDREEALEAFEHRPQAAWLVMAGLLVLLSLAAMVGQAVGSVGS